MESTKTDQYIDSNINMLLANWPEGIDNLHIILFL